MTDFDRDPAALAWARAKIEQYVTRLADFEQQCAAKGDEASVRCFRIVQRHISHYFLGDGGCTIGAFDERRPGYLDSFQPAATRLAEQPQFGIPGCTCRPWTRQEDPPRYLDRPGDTVDMISGWERGADCAHHAAAHDDGPTVREAAADDRRWDTERAGE